MKHKLTEWYPGHVKPVRIGVYQTMPFNDAAILFQYWGGLRWSPFAPDEKTAEHYKHLASAFQNPKWRGIKK